MNKDKCPSCGGLIAREGCTCSTWFVCLGCKKHSVINLRHMDSDERMNFVLPEFCSECR
jgi:hypothetical protein